MSTTKPVAGRDVTLPLGALAAWRRARGLTQSGLGEVSGVSESLIALIESGRRAPSLRTAIALAAALELPLDALAIVHVELPVAS